MAPTDKRQSEAREAHVLQGVPGDGMANVFDSMPVLEYHGSLPGSPAVTKR